MLQRDLSVVVPTSHRSLHGTRANPHVHPACPILPILSTSLSCFCGLPVHQQAPCRQRTPVLATWSALTGAKNAARMPVFATLPFFCLRKTDESQPSFRLNTWPPPAIRRAVKIRPQFPPNTIRAIPRLLHTAGTMRSRRATENKGNSAV